MSFQLFHSDVKTLYTSVAVLIFAVVFLSVGISRWVEFLDFNFSPLRRMILVVIHVAGCLVLSVSFALFAIDLDRRFAPLIMGLLASALVLLFPIHIYLGLLRRKNERAKMDPALARKTKFF